MSTVTVSALNSSQQRLRKGFVLATWMIVSASTGTTSQQRLRKGFVLAT